MARGHKHIVGLDIGSSAIKAVELRRSGSSIELLGRPAIVPTPENSVEGGVVVDTAAVAGALGDACEMGGFKTKNTFVSVGGDSSVVVRITEVPKMSGKELDEAIQWELDRQTPFPIDQTIYDYQTIEPPDADPNAQNMEVLIAVAQEDMVNAHVDSMLSAKMVPVAVDVEPLAISRALIDIADGAYADQTIGIVHIGATATLIIIVRKGLLTFVRSVPNAGGGLTGTIRQNFMGDEKLAEYVKRQFADLSEAAYDAGEGTAPPPEPTSDFDEGDADSVFEAAAPDAGAVGRRSAETEAAVTQVDMPDAAVPLAPQPPAGTPSAAMSGDELAAREVVYEAIAPSLVDLATEIRRSIDFYRRQHRNEEVDRLLLSGGSAVMKGLADFMAAETGITTVVADPFEHIQCEDRAISRQYLHEIGPAMVVAVGLALRDMV